jgi:hypothetical protein
LLLISGIGTTEVNAYQYTRDNGQRVFLLDTPGFDDSRHEDGYLLEKIGAFLCEMYKHDYISIGGLIYVHRITDTRMAGSSLKSLRIFENLCGENNFENVNVITTMWDLLETVDAQPTAGFERERILREKSEFFGRMMRNKAKMRRFGLSYESAFDIIESIAESKQRIVTSLQREMVDEGVELRDTAVGQFLQNEFETSRKRYEEEIGILQEEYEEAIDDKERELLKAQKVGYEKQIKNSEMDQRRLAIKSEQLTEKQLERRLEEAKRRDMEVEDQTRRVAELQDQLERTEMEHARELTRLKIGQKGQGELAEKRFEQYEADKMKLQDQLNNAKAEGKLKQKESKKYRNQIGFLERVQTTLMPNLVPNENFLPSFLTARRTGSFPLGPAVPPRRKPRSGHSNSRQSSNHRYNRDVMRTQDTSDRQAEEDYSSSDSGESIERDYLNAKPIQSTYAYAFPGDTPETSRSLGYEENQHGFKPTTSGPARNTSLDASAPARLPRHYEYGR